MRKLLNTIYVTTPELYISKEGETIVFHKNESKLLQIPSHNIEGIVILGHSTVTSGLFQLCAEKNIHISFVSHTGRFLAKIQSPISGNVKLRRKQYRLSDDVEEAVAISKNFAIAKIFNCRTSLQRLVRDHGAQINSNGVQEEVQMLGCSIRAIEKARSLAEIRGLEGEAAKRYFGVFNEFILDKTTGFRFEGRSRRPPKDEINALLSFFYIMQTHEIEAAIETVGLDPQVGFLHQERPGRSALALDLVEEFRAFLVDRFVISLINMKQIKQSDFDRLGNGAVLLKDEKRKELLQLWQKRKQECIIHPFLKEKVEIGLLPYAQALLLARYIRGDSDGYPAFFAK